MLVHLVLLPKPILTVLDIFHLLNFFSITVLQIGFVPLLHLVCPVYLILCSFLKGLTGVPPFIKPNEHFCDHLNPLPGIFYPFH